MLLLCCENVEYGFHYGGPWRSIFEKFLGRFSTIAVHKKDIVVGFCKFALGNVISKVVDGD